MRWLSRTLSTWASQRLTIKHGPLSASGVSGWWISLFLPPSSTGRQPPWCMEDRSINQSKSLSVSTFARRPNHVCSVYLSGSRELGRPKKSMHTTHTYSLSPLLSARCSLTHRTAPPFHPHTSNVCQLLLQRRPPAPVQLLITAAIAESRTGGLLGVAFVSVAVLPDAAGAESLLPQAAATVPSRRRRRVWILRSAAAAVCAGAAAVCAEPVLESSAGATATPTSTSTSTQPATAAVSAFAVWHRRRVRHQRQGWHEQLPRRWRRWRALGQLAWTWEDWHGGGTLPSVTKRKGRGGRQG